MIVLDPKLLTSIRLRCCAWCGKRPPCDAAHILGKGAGRVDIKENVAALCRTCHSSQHAGKSPTVYELLERSASRHNTTPETIRVRVWVIRSDKSCKVRRVS